MNFVIYLHWPYEECNGGLNVQLQLAKRLSEKGFKTKVRMQEGYAILNPIYNDFYRDGDVNEDTVAVYIDTFDTNPLNAKRVVKWCVYGSKNYEKYADDDIIYYFAPFCKNNTSTKRLCPVYIPSCVGNRHSRRIRESCYIIKKGEYYPYSDNLIPGFKRKSIVSFINSPQKPLHVGFIQKHTDLVNIFNETKYFFCYDPVSFLPVIALLCGCIVIQHPIPGYTESEWINSGSYFGGAGGNYSRIPGIAYGEENLGWAIATMPYVEQFIREWLKVTDTTVDSFVDDLQNKECAPEKCYKFNESPYSFQHEDYRSTPKGWHNYKYL
jgi:hypothetical protein